MEKTVTINETELKQAVKEYLIRKDTSLANSRTMEVTFDVKSSWEGDQRDGYRVTKVNGAKATIK